MVMVVIALKPECITMTAANKASYNCTNLGIPLINMNLAEYVKRNPQTMKGKFNYLVFNIVPSKSGTDVIRQVAVQWGLHQKKIWKEK